MPRMVDATATSPLHTDLVELVQVTRAAERDLFAMLSPAIRDTPATIGTWSAKDVQAHIAAWSAIETRRLDARAGRGSPDHANDPGLDDPIDESNANLHAQHADLDWEAVEGEADASVNALITAFARSSTDILCECPTES
jgi:hypothetical protein